MRNRLYMDQMKPEHENFLLIPGSNIRIDTEGRWFYRGMEMTRRDVVRLFYKNLIQGTSGEYLIKIGPQLCPVEVEDAPYVVWSTRYAEKNDTLEYIDLLLSDDRVERLDPATLWIGRDNIPYCRILTGRFTARFSKSSYYQIADHFSYDSRQESYCLTLNGRSYYLPVT